MRPEQHQYFFFNFLLFHILWMLKIVLGCTGKKNPSWESCTGPSKSLLLILDNYFLPLRYILSPLQCYSRKSNSFSQLIPYFLKNNIHKLLPIPQKKSLVLTFIAFPVNKEPVELLLKVLVWVSWINPLWYCKAMRAVTPDPVGLRSTYFRNIWPAVFLFIVRLYKSTIIFISLLIHFHLHTFLWNSPFQLNMMAIIMFWGIKHSRIRLTGQE